MVAFFEVQPVFQTAVARVFVGGFAKFQNGPEALERRLNHV